MNITFEHYFLGPNYAPGVSKLLTLPWDQTAFLSALPRDRSLQIPVVEASFVAPYMQDSESKMSKEMKTSAAANSLFAFTVFALVFATLQARAQVRFDNRAVEKQQGFKVRDSGGWLNKRACQDFIDYNQRSINTYGLVVLKNGQSALEMYGRGADENKLFKLWSVSKTFTALWLGTEIQKGTLTLDTPVANVLKEFATAKSEDWNTEYRKRIRARHLWTFSSGLDWCEADTCDSSPLLELYYGPTGHDALRFIRNRNMRNAPGRTYNYSSADVTLLSAMIQRLHTPQDYEHSPESGIFSPLGIDQWVLKRDQRGVYLSGADLFLRTRDTAKLGQLILQRGKWATEASGQLQPLMPEAYFKEMISVSRALKSPDTPEEIRRYEGPSGGLVWLNQTIPGIPKFLRRAPNDTIYTNGAFGQFLMVFPSAGIVIARNGADSEFSEIWEPFVEKALSCLAPDQIRPDDGSKQAPEPGGAILDTLKLFNTLRANNMSARVGAVEVCDCLFVGKFKSTKTCEALLAQEQIRKIFPPETSVDWENKVVTVRTQMQDPTKFLLSPTISTARAVYRPKGPHDGCTLE